MTVGGSSKSTNKHGGLNKLVGREVGAVVYIPDIRTYAIVDLTAGDGRPNAWSGTNSPEILAKHIKYVNDHGKRGYLTLVEHDPVTHATLKDGFGERAEVILGDAREPGTVDITGADAAFINNDPNTIATWALDLTAIKGLPLRTTTFSTLGCNVGGIRRMLRANPDLIEKWRNQVWRTVDSLPLHHDALIIALENDASRWGYLMTGPVSWRRNYSRDARRVFGEQIRTGWARQQPEAFRSILEGYLIADLAP